MFSDGLTRALWRRWYLTLAGIIMTIGLCGLAYVFVPPTYEARADVLLLPPKARPGDNPYLGLGGLREVTEVLSRSLVDDATAESLLPKGASATYTVDRDFTVASPIVLVLGDDKTPQGAMDIMNQVVRLLPPRLAQLQEATHAPTSTFVTSTMVKIDDKATAVRKTQLRALIASGALGIFLTVLLVALADKLARGRARRRHRDAHAAQEKAASPSPPAPPAPPREDASEVSPAANPHGAENPARHPVDAAQAPAGANDRRRRAASDTGGGPVIAVGRRSREPSDRVSGPGR